jgi:hypothetical protein
MVPNKSLIHTAEVREVQAAFERWRSGKKQGREPIPPKLWKMAAALCETYSVNRVGRSLGLNHTALKSQVDKRRPARRREASASAKPALHTPGERPPRRVADAFVEWALPAGAIPGTSATEYVVEAPDHRHATPRIHVRGASVQEVAALVRALRDNDEAA